MGAQHPRPARRPHLRRARRRRDAVRVPAAADQQAGRRRPRRAAPADRRPVVPRRRAQAVELTPSGSRTATPSSASSSTASARSRTPRCRSGTTATTCSASPRSWPRSRRRWPARRTCTTPRTPAWPTSSALTGNEHGRVFTGQRRGEFQEFLKTRFSPGHSGAPYADALLASRIAPSKQLLALAADEVQRREMFVLLDEQRDAYNYVLHAVERARRANTKTAVIVSGGPGSGKSVIALSLLGELSRQGRTGAARDRVAVVHPDPAQGRRRSGTAGAEDVPVLQLVHGRRAQRPRRPDPRRGAPDPRDLGLALDAGRAPDRTAADRGADRRRPGAGVPARRVPGGPPGRAGHRRGHREARRRARTPRREASTSTPSSVAAARRSTSSGSSGCSASSPAGRSRGPATRTSRSRSSTVPCEMEAYLAAKLAERLLRAHRRRLLLAVERPAAGRLARPGRADRRLVAGRGTSRATARSAEHRPLRCGPPTRPASVRSAASTPRRASSTTTPASSSAPTSCGATTAGSPSAAPTGIPTSGTAPRSATTTFDRLVRNVYKVLLTRGMRGVAIYSTDEETREQLLDLLSQQTFAPVT